MAHMTPYEVETSTQPHVDKFRTLILGATYGYLRGKKAQSHRTDRVAGRTPRGVGIGALVATYNRCVSNTGSRPRSTREKATSRSGSAEVGVYERHKNPASSHLVLQKVFTSASTHAAEATSSTCSTSTGSLQQYISATSSSMT
eukprot:6193956-Pleurochrysis_carterae.AAC.3